MVMFKLTLPQTFSEAGGEYDVIIVGGGVAGLTAALYSARYGLKTIVLTKDIGGTTAIAGIIEDYPGFEQISGEELVNRIVRQVKKYGVPIILDIVSEIKGNLDEKFRVIGSSGEYIGRTVIIAVGAERRRLNVPGEEKYIGRGVSYCAVCDAPLFKDKVVAIVGGGDSAVKEAIHLSQFVKKLYVIHRRKQFRAIHLLVEKLLSRPNVETVLERRVVEIGGNDRVKYVVLDDGRRLNVDGVFIDIGIVPPKEFFIKNSLKVDEKGYLIVDSRQMTSREGIFAAGDCTNACNRFHQIVTAAAQGALAADSIFKLIINRYGETLLKISGYR
ncbi:MAG TPA: FAD-binding protein [Thermoprotei archaeon]|nr:FAD-binding protein [Thermoprotei archaeon]